MSHKFEFTSNLSSDADNIWPMVSTIEGVNYELMPFVKMTAPGNWYQKPISDWPLNQYLFTSCILFLGFIPIDFHFFRMKFIFNKGFEEYSSSLMNKFWNHRRILKQSEDGSCVIKDSVSFNSRIPFVGYLASKMYQIVFWNRHRKLKRKYGSKVK